MITCSFGLMPAVGDKLMAADNVDGVATVVDVGNDVTAAAGAMGVALARTDATDLAGRSCGSVITRLCDRVTVSVGLIANWLTAVTLGTV